MSTAEDGGSVFPSESTHYTGATIVSPGMSVWDYYFAAAMRGILSNPGGPLQANPLNGWGLTNCTRDHVLVEAAAWADGMIALRAERRP